jgi:hypothetical protein
MIPSDQNVIGFITRQAKLMQTMNTDQLVHVAGSFGKPGSMTLGGQMYKQHATELAELNLMGLLYALKMGYAELTDIVMPDDYLVDKELQRTPFEMPEEIRQYRY